MPDTTPTTRYSAPDLTLLGPEHVERYVETGGAVGHDWNGVTCLVLWTVGRRTGLLRASPLIYAPDGANYVVIASQGGAPAHPGWYHNLVAQPRVEAQVLADRFRATARTARGEERQRLWTLMAERWPNYDTYATRTSREIPVVVLERA
jgi:deazaflavin-dependent oxidoreductase (nitroreductase family)